tara:strand:- start:234 stop:1100 length:867 start_codon:yes stop_codon:yes gene_type:complete
MRVLAFGEVLWDVINGQYHIGGAPLNFAAHCVQCKIPAALVSAYGNDELGRLTLEKVKSLKVDTSFLQKANRPTGTVPVRLISGQPQYEIVENVAFDFIDYQKIDPEALQEFDYFYFGTLVQRNEASRTSLRKILEICSFRQVFLDVNIRQNFYDKPTLEYSLKQSTILKLNDEEVGILANVLFFQSMGFNEFTEKVMQAYPNVEVVIITKGKDGCLVRSVSEIIDVPAPIIRVKDTVGAGDAFSAAFCATYFASNDLHAAVKNALRVGGFVASKSGAIPFYDNGIWS